MRPVFTIGLSLTTLLAAPPAIVQAQSVDDLYRQADAAYSAGDYARAAVIFRQLLAIDPTDAFAHTNLGTVLADQGQYEAAEAAHREAIQLDPNFAVAYDNLGTTLADQGQYEAAEVIHREATLALSRLTIIWGDCYVFRDGRLKPKLLLRKRVA